MVTKVIENGQRYERHIKAWTKYVETYSKSKERRLGIDIAK
jgi:hypothetical protein